MLRSHPLIEGDVFAARAILSSLKSLLETGEALVIKMEPPKRMLEALKKLGIATP